LTLLAATTCPAPRGVEPVEEGIEAGCESFVAVVEPDMLAKSDQGGEAVSWQ
jgi:hypothetical protein